MKLMTADGFSVGTAEIVAPPIVEGDRVIGIAEDADFIPFVPLHLVRTFQVGSRLGDFAEVCFDARYGFQPLGRFLHFPAAGSEEQCR